MTCTVVCGQGRLATRILSMWNPPSPQFARLLPEAGLHMADARQPASIDTLLLCLVPRHPEGGSGWLGLLDGVVAQVARGELQIGRALLVSSSAVYESQATGWVTAATPVTAASPRSAGLIAAEQAFRQLSADTCVARLTGITGPGYERYQPLTYADTEAKHAVDVRAAAEAIAARLHAGFQGHITELLTDGRVYFQSRVYDLERDREALDLLAKTQRLQRPSRVCRWLGE